MTTPLYPTSFSQLIGNEKNKKYLEVMIAKEAVGHALLFCGLEGVGKSLFALALAARVIASCDGEKGIHKIAMGQHPDLHILRPEGKIGLHSLQSLRDFSEQVYLPPYESSWKVFIIHDADRMHSYSANALLKTFEEPPPRTLIILLTSSFKALLPTILSRCRVLYFNPLPATEIEGFLKEHHQVDDETASRMAYFAEGSLGKATRLLAQQGHSLSTHLLKLLASGPTKSYLALQKVIETVVKQLEVIREEVEQTAKKELCQLPNDQLSAVHKESIEKEILGYGTMVMSEQVKQLFNAIYSWYRDLHLIAVGGDYRFLMNKEHQDALEQECKRGHFLSLEQVGKMIREAELGVERSTPPGILLNSLFLKLNRI